MNYRRAIEPHQRPRKERGTPPKACPEAFHAEFATYSWPQSVSQAKLKEEVSVAFSGKVTTASAFKKVIAQNSGKLLNTERPTRWNRKKKANCFTLRRWITRSKLSIQRSNRLQYSSSYLARYSPKGSCHLVEPTWVTHLLRIVIANCELERVLRAKHNPAHLPGMG